MQDVHLTCALEHLYALVDSLEEQYTAQREEVTVLDWGCSYKQTRGYIVLEWEDEVDEAFIEQLAADETIADFCVYTIPCTTDDQLSMLEHAEL
jgi:hypothetical protein